MPFHPPTHPQLARVADDVLLFEKKLYCGTVRNGTELHSGGLCRGEDQLFCAVL